MRRGTGGDVGAASAATDASLLAAAALDDRGAFALLHDRHAPTLLGLTLHVLSVRSEAEDVLETAFLQMWRAAADFDPERDNALTWMTRITRTAALERLRSRGPLDFPSAVGVAPPMAVDRPVPADEAPADEVGRDEGAVARRVLALLPAAERDVLHLAYFEGLSEVQVAERLGAPLDTVKTNVRTALRTLRAAVAAPGP